MTEKDSSAVHTDREHHPDEMLLAAFSDGDLEPGARQTIEAHIVDCEICLGTLTMLAKTSDQTIVVEPPTALKQKVLDLAGSAPRTDQQQNRGQNRFWASAAALFMILGAGLIWTTRHDRSGISTPPTSAPDETRGFRGPPPQAVGPTLLSPQPGQILDPGSIEFRWSDVDGATEYTVLLVTADGDPVWQSKVARTQLLLPDNVPLVEGETYYVTLRAHLLEARALPSSHVEFQVGHRR